MGKKKVFTNSIIYTGSNLLIKAFSFFLLPLYTTYLTTFDYGTINLISGFISVMSFIISFSLYTSILRFYTDIKTDQEKVKVLFGTIIIFTFISGVIFSFLIIIFNNLASKYIFRDIKFYPTVIIGLLSLIFNCLYHIYQEILRSMQQAKKFAFNSILFFFSSLCLNIVFVVILKWGSNGVVLATLITNFIFTINMLFDLRRNNLIQYKVDLNILKNTLKYSIPLLPHQLSTTVSSFISRVFINNNFSLSNVGIFSLAVQIGSVADMIQASFCTAFQPWLFEQLKFKKYDYKTNIIKISETIIWTYGLIFLGIALFSQDFILLFLNANYVRAWTVVPLIVISFSIKTPYYFYIGILLYHKNATKFIFTATLSSSIINVILSALLIPHYDMYGSVISDIIAMLIRVIIIIYLANKYENIGYKISKFIFLVLINIIFIIIGLLFSYTKYIYTFNNFNFLYKIFVFIIYIIIFIYFQKQYIYLLITKRGKFIMNIKTKLLNVKLFITIWILLSKIWMYFLNKILRIDNDKVVFISFSGKSYSDNPKAISEKLYELRPNTKIVWLLKNANIKSKIVPSYVKCIEMNKHNYLKEHATSKVWVNNFTLLPNIYKNKNQYYIQTWHGDRGFKKVMYDSIYKEKYDLVENKICDLCIAGSQYGIDVYKSAIKFNGEILNCGSPRNDILIHHSQNHIKAIKDKLEIKNQKILLYAPTFRRKDSNDGSMQKISNLNFNDIIYQLDESTNENWVVLARAHSAVNNEFAGLIYNEKIINVSLYEDMAELLLISDILVTDYSSSAGDFALLNRPIILYQPDKKEYIEKDRSLYFDMDKSPYIVALDQVDLVKKLIEKYYAPANENCKKILEFYKTNETGQASRYVAEIIISKLGK